MQDTYYQRSEVSNSDLTELKNLLYPRTQYGDKEKAFKFGSLIDAMITEPERVRYDKRMVFRGGFRVSGSDETIHADGGTPRPVLSPSAC